MPPAAATPAGPAAGQGGGQQQQQRGPAQFLGGLFRAVLMWYFMRQFMGNKGAPKPGAPPGSALTPALPRGMQVDVHFFVSEHKAWEDAALGEPVWVAGDVSLGITKDKKHTILYRPSKAVQNNGSVYVHAVFTPPGASPNPTDSFFDRTASFAKTRPLNAYLKKKTALEGVNLLTGKNATDDAAPPHDVAAGNETVIISYLKPNVTLTMVDDYSAYVPNQIPPHYRHVIDINHNEGTYKPHVWFNEFWLLRDYLVPVNESVAEVPLHLEVTSMASWKFALFSQMDQSLSMQQSWGAMADGEADEVKRIFLEGNPYFLALTMVVSTLHSVFDMLAFKNDIGFWKANKSMEGLSARTIMINCFCQLVIFLYLLDSETSMVVLLSAGVGTAIEFWKVTKAMRVTVHFPPGSLLPRLRIKDRASYSKSKTDQYDAEAMRYLSYALYPLVGGYAIYSLVYRTHKSWYSWVLNSLVGAVYTFGFILMCPQLYLNYKLKSVAHLPWRQMTYKFLNTIIDDLFAFVIKMPLLHRLSVFRDDVIFLIYLYQRWIYRVDRKRTNEFGYAEERPDNEEEQEEEDEGKVLVKDETDDEPENKGEEQQLLQRRAAQAVVASAAGTGSDEGPEGAAAAAAETKKEK